jgi:hypothetical protein
MNWGQSVDAAGIKSLIDEAMKIEGFERLGRSRWLCSSSEVLWVIEADRARSRDPWAVMVGAVVKGWSPDLASPHASDGHLISEYVFLTSAVPEAAEGTRFDDHTSYFTMAFDHNSGGMDLLERRAAMAFMAQDIARFCRHHATLQDLVLLVRSGGPGRMVHRRLRDYAAND